LFVLGLFIGILIVNVGHDMWVLNSTLLGSEMLEKIEASTLDGGMLFGYILKRRLFTVCMLGLFATTVFGMAVLCCYICFAGFSAGCLLSVASARYGIKGVLLMGAGIFPQGLFLIPGYAALFLWAAGLNRKQFYLKKGLQMIGIIIVIVIGCLIESYVNPKILHLVLKIF
jgi:uncharacterized membrane protein SpoIIM required for sporulation